MAWQPYLQSSLYLAIQSLELAAMVPVPVMLGGGSVTAMASQACVCIGTFVVCVACTGFSSPPVYYGNQVTNDYLRVLMILGTVTCDLPLLILRFVLLPWVLSEYRPGDAHFFIFLAKDCLTLSFLVCFVVSRCRCACHRYQSLSSVEPETLQSLCTEEEGEEEEEMTELEDTATEDFV